jgi:hypothetical protein
VVPTLCWYGGGLAVGGEEPEGAVLIFTKSTAPSSQHQNSNLTEAQFAVGGVTAYMKQSHRQMK